MGNSVSFKFTNDSKKPTNGEFNIKLRIKYGTTKKVQQIGVVINEKHWDEKGGRIKPSFESLYTHELDKMRSIESKYPEVRSDLMEGKMTYESAFILLNNKTEDESLLAYIEHNMKPDAKRKQGTINKHRMNVSAIQTKLFNLGYDHLSPLKFSHLADKTSVKDISTALVRESSLSNNTLESYLKTLNLLTAEKDRFPDALRRPFTEFIPSIKPSTKTKSKSKNEMMIGLNKIKTLHQLEAYLFWMYSFCLMGLDGTDICNISEDKIVNDDIDEISDYIPDVQLNSKIHIGLSRGKSEVDCLFMVNLFPTLMIRDLLHYVISITSPQDAYMGQDRLQLFSFKTRDKNGKDDLKGMAKWENKRKSYVQVMRKRIDTSTQDTRKTVTKIAQDLSIPLEKIDVILNHTTKGVIKHYIEKDQTERDVYHIHILQEYGIIELLRTVIQMFERVGKTEKGFPFIPNDKSFWVKPASMRRENLMIDSLTEFSIYDEMEYQRLMNKYSEGESYFNPETGIVEVKKLSFESFPPRLKELHSKREQVSDIRTMVQGMEHDKAYPPIKGVDY